MAEQFKFVCRKRKGKYSEDITWINAARMPYYNPATISLYAGGESVFKPGYRGKSFPMSYWALEYICEGEFAITREDTRYILHPGDVLILYPRMHYARANPGTVSVKKKEIMLNNSPLLSILCNRSALNAREVIRCGDPAAVEAVFDRVLDLISAADTKVKIDRELPNTLFALFTEIIAQCGEQNVYTSFDDQLKQLNIFSPDLTLETMAEHFKTGKRTLNRLFSKRLNLSPFQYVITMRMRYAVQLLGSNTLSIREVAEECGYKNTSFFIAEFKKYFRKTPLEYRNSKDIFNNRKVHLLDGWNRKPKAAKN